jgi:DNA ligase (NAD+)
VVVRVDELADKMDAIREELIGDYEYPVDGLIAEILDEDVKAAAGATGHHHVWMVAIKQKGETAVTTVEGITWQIGRSGRLTPVVLVKPVSLTGCTISKVTAHHAMNVLNEGIGEGAVVEILRSGDVIPFLNSIVKPAPDANCLIPTECPCCGEPTVMQKDFLVCTNDNCADRKTAQIEHFFSILGNIDLFGPKTCATLVEHGVTSLVDIFTLSESDYAKMGFGPGQAANLVKEIEQAKGRSIDDYRLLAAFGISHLGRGDSKKLLGHVAIDELAIVTEELLMGIKGFGRITSQSIAASLQGILDDLAFMLAHFTNIERTPLKANVVAVDSPIAGKHLVFTGAMSKSRDEMKTECESLSGIAQGSVNKKTDYLVIGDKVGESKLTKARGLGITIITEEEYRAMLGV